MDGSSPPAMRRLSTSGSFLKPRPRSALVPFRKFCSKDRIRFIDGDFDLDLTYITPQVVAMAFPAAGLESAWRNHIDDVAAMLNQYHKDHYMIWNLSDKDYDYMKFNNNVLEFGFPDHHSPPLDMLFKIVLTMHNWITADEQNVAVVHCLGGKGRTGTVICSYLFFAGLFTDPLEALDFFAQKRSKIENGVKQPSQKRYVLYFNEVLRSSIRPIAPSLLLTIIRMNTIPNYSRKKKGCSPCIQIFDTTKSPGNIAYSSSWEEDISSTFLSSGKEGNDWFVNAVVRGDVMITCTHLTEGKKRKLMFKASFHTAFINGRILKLPVEELDGIKQKKDISFDPEFYIELRFHRVEEQRLRRLEDEQADKVYEKIFSERAKQIGNFD